MKNLDKKTIAIIIFIILFILAIITSLFSSNSNKIKYDDSKVTISFEDTEIEYNSNTDNEIETEYEEYTTELNDSTEFVDNTEFTDMESTEGSIVDTEQSTEEIIIGDEPENTEDDGLYVAEYNFDYLVSLAVTDSLTEEDKVNCSESFLTNLNSFVDNDLRGNLSKIMITDASFISKYVTIQYNDTIYKFVFEVDNTGKLNKIIKQ